MKGDMNVVMGCGGHWSLYCLNVIDMKGLHASRRGLFLTKEKKLRWILYTIWCDHKYARKMEGEPEK